MLVQLAGNVGDQLIDAGTRRMLPPMFTVTHAGPCPGWADWHSCSPDSCPTREFRGTLIISGGGSWSRTFHDTPSIVEHSQAERIVVLPSSFDLGVEPVARALSDSRVTAFARERVSALASGLLAHCPSFFFDYRPWLGAGGSGRLTAFRLDAESAGGPIPPWNIDLSLVKKSLGDWLLTISTAEEVWTDRAHVMVAAALMGKRVRYRDGSYFKVRAMAETWLADYDVEPLS